MLTLFRWRVVAGSLLIAVPCSDATAQSASNLRLGPGQHVHIATRDGTAFDGYVRFATDTQVRLRVRASTHDNTLSLPRTDIEHVEVAVPQANSPRNALIGGAVGFATGALAAWALGKERQCLYPGECVRISFSFIPVLGLATGLIVGWHERPTAWLPVVR